MTESNEPTSPTSDAAEPAPQPDAKPEAEAAPAASAPATAVAERDQLLDHNYDGIQEYDNPLPGWWSGVFIACIVFAVFYAIYYHFGPGNLMMEEYAADQKAQQELAAKAAGPVLTDDALRALTEDSAAVAAGATVFQTRCIPCHGDKAQGVIGPNLTDEYWIHGGKPTEINHTIRVGVPAKGMISWEKMLSPTEIANVTAFVLTLKGTNPPGAKAPEGEKVE